MGGADRTSRDWLERDFFEQDFLVCARRLVGCELCREDAAGRIVEAEAYAVEGDAAGHTFTRRSARGGVERNPAGTAYVYLNYGMHWLINVLVKGRGRQGIVLILALVLPQNCVFGEKVPTGGPAPEKGVGG
jgi:DNA-3-methyladenine glycosylase